MNTRNLTSRILSMVLVFVMVFGMVPFQTFAAETAKAVDAAIIFTDLHTSNGDYKESTVKSVMTTFKNAGLPISSVTSGGDAFSSNESVYTAYTDILTGYIRGVLGNDTSVNYVWSDHDRGAQNNSSSKAALDKTSHLVYGAGQDGVYGTADDGNYYVYALSMADLCTYDRYSTGFNYTASSNNRSKNGYTSTVPQAIENFLTDAASLNKDRPLFIVSHQPLFDNRNDNGWAEDWCNAINQVATEMDVAFFYGHNHKYDSGSDYYYAKGSTMPVATRKHTDGSSWNFNYQVGDGWQYNKDLASVNKVLNFTHMCAGYMSPATESGTTRKGTAIAAVIYEDSIRYTTYHSNGIYTGSYAVDMTVPRTFAPSEPELVVSGADAYFVGSQLDLTVYEKVGSKTTDVTAKTTLSGFDMNAVGDYTVHITYGDLCAEMPIIVREKTFRDAATGITAEVSTPGATSLTVGTLATDSKAFLAAAGLLSSTAYYTISMADCKEAALTLPVPAGVTTPVVYHISDDGETIVRVDAKAAADGKSVSFTTGSFGAYIIGQQEINEELENTVVAGGTSYVDKTVYVRVDTFENGGKYLLIGEDGPANANPNPIAYLNNNGNEGKQIVTIQKDAVTSGSATYTKGYIELNNAQAVWTASGSSSKGFTLSNNGKYIGGDTGNTVRGSASEALAVVYDAAAVRLKTASGTTKYLYYSTYSGEDWKWSTSIDSSSSSRQVWIYKEMPVHIPTSTAVTYTVQAENVHHLLTTNTLQLQYSLLANGGATELPQGARYSFEVKNDGNGIIKSISDTGLMTFNKAVGGCYVKIACTWNGGTAYKYVRITTEADPNACDHSYESVTVNPTCTVDGSVTYTCICGDSYVEVIKATGHDYKAAVTAPTCTEDGYTTYTCACGHTYTADRVAAPGHTYKSVTVKATCTKDGSVTYTCACGDTYVEIIKATGHDYKAAVTAPTCTEGGYTTYTCACGDSYIADETKALGHIYQAKVTKPTCTEEGFTTYTCACGQHYTADIVAALGHTYQSVTVEATCTKDGSVTYTCACGDTYVEVIKATGHAYTSVVTAPTCTEEGGTVHTCTNCGHNYTTDKVAALGHRYTSVVLAPTCSAEGYTVHCCTTCGHSYTANRVAALGHDYESVTIEATCTVDGSVTYTCYCGDTYVEVIQATGHAYKSVTIDATCTENGSTTYTCPCGDTYTEVIRATGHDYKATVTKPTCTAAGYTTYTCACGHHYTADQVAALGHTYKSVTAKATCTEDGSITYTCTCGDTYTEVIQATGHDHKATVTPPTCTKDGYTTYTCACGDTYTADEVQALGHDYNATVTAPTCTATGYTTYTCHCGHSYTTDVVAALGHKYASVTAKATCTEDGSITYTCTCGDTYTEVIQATGHDHKATVTPPTCTKDGYTTYTCACGDTYTADKIAALGHSYVCTEDGDCLIYTCSNCGNAYTEVLAREWVKVSTGAYVLDTDGIDVGPNHKYIVVAEDKDYAMTLINDTIGAAAVTIQNNMLTVSNAANYEFYFADNSSREKDSYLLTRDSSKSVYHVSSEIRYGHDSKGYWHIGSSSNGTYQLYDQDGSNWYLNYGYAWANNSVSRFAGSTSARSVRLFQYADAYARLAGSVYQTYTVSDGAAADSIAKNLRIETSTDGVNTSGTMAATADMIHWNSTFNSTVPGVYTATITYQGVQLGTIRVTISEPHNYQTQVIAPTCTAEGYTIYTCTDCGYSKNADYTAALGHSYSCIESNGYLVYTCGRCSHSYSEKAISFTQVSSISSGKNYVITLYANNRYYALSHANNQISLTEVSVSNGGITSQIRSDLLWNYNGSTLSYQSNGTTYYLYSYSNSWWGGWWGGSVTLSISNSNSSTVSFSNNGLKIGFYYLNYSNGSATANSSATTTYLFVEK